MLWEAREHIENKTTTTKAPLGRKAVNLASLALSGSGSNYLPHALIMETVKHKETDRPIDRQLSLGEASCLFTSSGIVLW